MRPRVQFNIVNTNESEPINKKLTALNIEFGTIEKYLRGVDVEGAKEVEEVFQKSKTVYLMCRRGNASKEATELLLKNSEERLGGFKDIVNIQGGIEEIRRVIDGKLPLY